MLTKNVFFIFSEIWIEWDISKHWAAIFSIILIIGAVGVAVPLALRVSSGKLIPNSCGLFTHINQSRFLYIFFLVDNTNQVQDSMKDYKRPTLYWKMFL